MLNASERSKEPTGIRWRPIIIIWPRLAPLCIRIEKPTALKSDEILALGAPSTAKLKLKGL